MDEATEGGYLTEAPSPGQGYQSKYIVKELCQQLRQSISPEKWTKFCEQKTDRGRLELFINSEEIQSCVTRHLQLHPSSKDKAKALVLKAAGNKAFGRGDNEEALHLYTQCLAWMPYDETKDAGIVHANRSAALFHLNELSLAEKDAELAFTLHYPSGLHYKLYERLGRCCLLAGRSSEAIKNFQQAIKALEMSDLDESKRMKTKKTLEDLCKTSSNANLNALNKPNTGIGICQCPTQPLVIPEVEGGSHKHLKSVSRKAALVYREKHGRFIIAEEVFKPGDVIAVEKAFVSILLPHNYHRQCFQCYNPLRAPFPCKTCILVSYCSTKCRDQAWKTHHKYECPILGVLKHSGISVICYLALRVLTQVDPKVALGWYETAMKSEADEIARAKVEVSMEKGSNCSGKMNKGTQESLGFNEEYRSDHVSFFHLVTHSQRRKAQDFFHQIVMTVYLIKALKATSYFEESLKASGLPSKNTGQGPSKKMEGEVQNSNISKKNGDSLPTNEPTTSISSNDEETQKTLSCGETDVELKLAYLILRSLQSSQFNTHETAGWDPYKEKDNSVGLGGAVFPTVALFNHSCNPGVVRYFVNDTVIVRAIRTILPGEVVHENYGQSFTVVPKEERQAKLLDYYWFECECVPCRENWPTFDEMTNDSMAMKFRCEFCRTFICKADESMGILFNCGKCGKPVNILKSLKSLHESEKTYKKALEFLEAGEEDTGLEMLLQNLSLLDSYLMPPFRDYHLCQEHVRKCLLNLGNKISQQPVWDPEKAP